MQKAEGEQNIFPFTSNNFIKFIFTYFVYIYIYITSKSYSVEKALFRMFNFTKELSPIVYYDI